MSLCAFSSLYFAGEGVLFVLFRANFFFWSSVSGPKQAVTVLENKTLYYLNTSFFNVSLCILTNVDSLIVNIIR